MITSGSSVITARPIASDLSARPGPDVEVTPSAVGRAEGGADAGDLVLGLEGGHVELLELAQLVQDVRGGRDGVGAQEDRHLGGAAGRDQAVGHRGVAGDLAVTPLRQLGRLDLVLGGERLGGLAVVPARAQGEDVGLEDGGLLAELVGEELLDRVDRAAVHPGEQPEREHVLAALGVLLADVHRLDRADGQRAHGHLVHLERLEGGGAEGAGLVADLGEVALGELVGVDDEDAAGGQVVDVGLERRGVHRHQHVGAVPGGEDVVVRDLDLEAGDTVDRALWGADLRGVVGLGRQVVAEGRGLRGELVAGELHAVARVARDADDHLVQLGLGHIAHRC
jgi:hypothetical protein